MSVVVKICSRLVCNTSTKKKKKKKKRHDNDDYYNDDELIKWYNGYKKRKAQKALIKEELMPITWHQSRYWDWFMSEDERKRDRRIMGINMDLFVSLKLIPDNLKIQEMCNEVVHREPHTLKFVPTHLRLNEMCYRVLEKYYTP